MSLEIPTAPSQEATIQQEYLRRLDEDLARNASAQQDAADAIARWQEHLAGLQQEAVWLTGLKNTLNGQAHAPGSEESSAEGPDDSPNAVQDESGALPQAVPAPRAARHSRAGSTSRGKKATQGSRPASRTKQDGRGSSPTLGSLIVALLDEHQQPRTAAEVTAALAAGHPDRNAQNPVVRNALEQLVAKSRIARHKQGKTVFYTASAQSGAVGATAPEPDVDVPAGTAG
ncbi:hypothetical protein ACIP98_40575 [Streptomyces sp. NPDC088354]|uniref:hypothetical protein n=1 Tax=Streptomyces sp. NPDC088354 TaxID=3365856 RepID=UPI00382DF7F5